MIKFIKNIVRRLDYSLSDDEVEYKANEISTKIENDLFDFSTYNESIITQGSKKRKIYNYEKMSTENILCHYLKKRMDIILQIKYSSRSKIINLLFNTLPVIKDLNDFVIIRADFKSFFDSVYTEHVFQKYIKNSLMTRYEKDLLKKYIDNFKYCYAGMCLSNGLAEIICRDFDMQIRARMEKYGVVLYERYVDDILIILNKYITKDKFLDLINQVIKEVFGKSPVKLNLASGKFSYISRRDIQPNQKFDFLGYEFFINYNNQFKFEYGITEKKRTKYKNIINEAFIDYKHNNNLELLRQRLKLFSSRVVVARSLGDNNFEWLTRGIAANYNELRFHMKELENITECFLKDIYIDLLSSNGISCPAYLKNSNIENSIYNLYSVIERNRSIVFEKNIGVKRRDLIKWIKKINPSYTELNKNYYQITIEYLELLKVE